MKRNIKNIIAISLTSLVLITGCKDNVMDEVTDVKLDRAFSITGLRALVVDKVNVRLTWEKVNDAGSYTIEVFDNETFTGNAVKTIPNISKDLIEYTVTNLDGDKEYFVRVKTISASGSADSKWVSAKFKTDPEQIFNTVNLADITAKTVILTWPAGAAVTSITVQPGNITHTITTAEKAAGSATITGLTGETVYTARLLNGTAVRGTISFTTALDLGDALVVNPTDNLLTKIAEAPAGAVLALMPGTYNVAAEIIITKNISIKGAKPAERPVIKGATIKVRANSGLTLKDLIIEGTGAADSHMIDYTEISDNAYGSLNIEDCLISNYNKGLVYANVKVLIETVNIKGNVMTDIRCTGADFIDFRNGNTKALNVTNNTFYKLSSSRDFIRMDAGGSTNFPAVTCIITVSNNTFNEVAVGTSNRIFYVRTASHQIFFAKNIVANAGGVIANQAATSIVAGNFSENNYFNASTYISGSTASSPKYDGGSPTTLNPGFANTTTGDFTISNAVLKAARVGDPRWIK